MLNVLHVLAWAVAVFLCGLGTMFLVGAAIAAAHAQKADMAFFVRGFIGALLQATGIVLLIKVVV